MEVEEKIWGYILKTFLGGKSAFDRHTFSFDKVALDSLSHVKLIFFLEKEFSVELDPEEVKREHLNDVNQIADLVRKKKSGN